MQSNLEKLKNEIFNEAAIISDIENQEIPKINQELQNLKKNFLPDESPESFCSMAKERVKIFEDLANKKKNIEEAKEKFEKDFLLAQNNLRVAEKNKKISQEKFNLAEKKYYEASNMRLEAILAFERKNLRPGMPCPLCGATEHPKIFHAEEKIKNIQNLDDGLKVAKNETDKAHQEFEAANKNFNLLSANESKARANFDNAVLEFNKISEQRAEAKSEISKLIDKLGFSVKSVGEIMPSIDAWLTKIKKLEENLKRLN